MASLIWFIIIIILLVAEVIAPGLTTIWFAGGAMATMLLSIFEVPIFMQIIFFAQVSFLLLYITRPLVKKFQQKPTEKTNYEAIIGRCGKVTEEIDNIAQTGQVNLDGQEWTARGVIENERIPTGCRVVVEEITGVKLIVRLAESKDTFEVENEKPAGCENDIQENERISGVGIGAEETHGDTRI